MKRQIIKLEKIMTEADIKAFTDKIKNAEGIEQREWLYSFQRYIAYSIRQRFPNIKNISTRSRYILRKRFADIYPKYSKFL